MYKWMRQFLYKWKYLNWSVTLMEPDYFSPTPVSDNKINYKIHFTNTQKHTDTPDSVKLIGYDTKLLLLKWSKVKLKCLLCLNLMKNSGTCKKLFQNQNDLWLFINKHSKLWCKLRAWTKPQALVSGWKLILAGARWGQLTRESENSESLFFPQGKVNL